MEDNNKKVSDTQVATANTLKSEKGKDYTFAIILIIVGAIFLLNNLGILPWNFWLSILQFWPIFLILLGLKMVFGNSRIANILLSIFIVLVVGLLILLAVIINNQNIFNGLGSKIPTISQIFNPEAQVREEKVSIDIPSDKLIENRKFDFDFGAGDFNIVDEKDLSKSLELNAKYVDGLGYPVTSNDVSGNTQEIGFETKSEVFRGLKTLYIINEMKYDFTIGQTGIPADFLINLGAGTAKFDFSDLKINSFEYSQGAGTGDITFSENSLPETLDIEVGAGTLKIFLPENAQYDFEYNIGAGTVKFDGQRLVTGDGSRKSDNFDKDNGITINLDLGAGTVDIVFVESSDSEENIDDVIIDNDSKQDTESVDQDKTDSITE